MGREDNKETGVPVLSESCFREKKKKSQVEEDPWKPVAIITGFFKMDPGSHIWRVSWKDREVGAHSNSLGPPNTSI